MASEGAGKAKELRPVAEVVQGLTTKADKIRALAEAGYLRADIAKVLEIRYQHVRQVLERSGIDAGRQRDANSARTVVVAPHLAAVAPTASRVLLDAGFRLLGQWQSVADGEFTLSAKAPDIPGVYAFVVDDVVMYVGLAQRGFQRRMGHYRRGHHRQRTSARVKALIAGALARGQRVEVLIAMPEDSNWNGLPINGAAGLEAGLIRMICPEWNLLGLHKGKTAVVL